MENENIEEVPQNSENEELEIENEKQPVFITQEEIISVLKAVLETQNNIHISNVSTVHLSQKEINQLIQTINEQREEIANLKRKIELLQPCPLVRCCIKFKLCCKGCLKGCAQAVTFDKSKKDKEEPKPSGKQRHHDTVSIGSV